jgi:hypothetical protein
MRPMKRELLFTSEKKDRRLQFIVHGMFFSASTRKTIVAAAM